MCSTRRSAFGRRRSCRAPAPVRLERVLCECASARDVRARNGGFASAWLSSYFTGRSGRPRFGHHRLVVGLGTTGGVARCAGSASRGEAVRDRRQAARCPADLHGAAALLCVSSAAAHVFRVGAFEGGTSTLARSRRRSTKPNRATAVLIGPGDPGDQRPPGRWRGHRRGGARCSWKAGISSIRGMDRNGVIIDGTKKGTPTCSAGSSDQELGPTDSEGRSHRPQWRERSSRLPA